MDTAFQRPDRIRHARPGADAQAVPAEAVLADAALREDAIAGEEIDAVVGQVAFLPVLVADQAIECEAATAIGAEVDGDEAIAEVDIEVEELVVLDGVYGVGGAGFVVVEVAIAQLAAAVGADAEGEVEQPAVAQDHVGGQLDDRIVEPGPVEAR